MTDFTPPIPVETNPFVPILTAVARQVITGAGVWLVARGYITQDASDKLAPEVLGGVMMLASVAWGAWKANHVTKKFAAIDARTNVTVAK